MLGLFGFGMPCTFKPLRYKRMTDYERIKNTFEERAVCANKQKPKLHCEPGCCWVECDLGDKCKCRTHQDSGEPLTPMLAEWAQNYT